MLHLRLFPFFPALLACFMAGLLLPAAPARAMEDVFSAQQEAVENPGGGMKIVTPLKDCLDKLPPDEAAAVQRNYLKPYQECHLRLQALSRRRAEGTEPAATATATRGKQKTSLRGDETSGADEDKKSAAQEPAAAESPRNFLRVRKDDGPRRPASYGDIGEKTAPESRPRPVWDSGYNR